MLICTRCHHNYLNGNLAVTYTQECLACEQERKTPVVRHKMASVLYKLVRLSDRMIVAEGSLAAMRKAAKAPGHKVVMGSPLPSIGKTI